MNGIVIDYCCPLSIDGPKGSENAIGSDILDTMRT
jgi:hypothetical protein